MNPWIILAALFFARLSLGYQFQLVASAAPQLQPAFDYSYTELGTLIGLYMLPGCALALPASWLGGRFGERRLVAIGLAMMTVGTLWSAVAPDTWHMAAGRLLSGFGAILMNVLMTKLVVDWFASGRLVLAMAIFVNSWPVGVGLALLVQAPLATGWGWPAAFLSGTVLAALGLIAFLAVHRDAPGAAAAGQAAWPTAAQWPGLTLASLTWSLFNVGFALVFSFGPLLLLARGADPVGAASLVSLVVWISAVVIPLAAAVVQRFDRGRLSAPLAALSYAIAIAWFAWGEASLAVFAALAVLGSVPPGAIMSLLPRFLSVRSRTLGTGIFYAIYYVGMAVGPAIAGWAVDASGTPATALYLAAGAAALAGLAHFIAWVLPPRNA
jgi:predicted MFS family arabinose efflux permease